MVIFHSYVKVYQRATCINIVLEKLVNHPSRKVMKKLTRWVLRVLTDHDHPPEIVTGNSTTHDHSAQVFEWALQGSANGLDLRVCSWQWRNSSWNFWSVYSWEFIIYNVNPMYSSAICTVALFDYGNYWRLQASDGTCWYPAVGPCYVCWFRVIEPRAHMMLVKCHTMPLEFAGTHQKPNYWSEFLVVF